MIMGTSPMVCPPPTTLKLFTPPTVYFDVFVSSHLITVFSGWVACGILKQYHWLSLVTWEKEGLSVLQVTSTCRQSWLVWSQTHNCAAENAILWDVMFCHPVWGCDSNVHHTAWGSSNCNDRGEVLVEILNPLNLEILNQGNEPTFCSDYRQEVIDINLGPLDF
jgi:hypothetical protein